MMEKKFKSKENQMKIKKIKLLEGMKYWTNNWRRWQVEQSMNFK